MNKNGVALQYLTKEVQIEVLYDPQENTLLLVWSWKDVRRHSFGNKKLEKDNAGL